MLHFEKNESFQSLEISVFYKRKKNVDIERRKCIYIDRMCLIRDGN